MRLAKYGLAAALVLAAGAVGIPERAEARSVSIHTPHFSLHVGPRYKKRYYKKRYYGKRYKRGYKKRYYYGRPYYKKRRHYYYGYRRW